MAAKTAIKAKSAQKAKAARAIPVKVPDFRSESEEADWWYANRELVGALLEKHGRNVGKPGKTFIEVDVELIKPVTKAISIRMAEPDLKRAKELAARKGIGYQTYIRSILHEALQKQA
jgi:hypothetical protein